MAKKTNKTSHVLNLITGAGGEPEPEVRQTAEPSQPEQNVVVVEKGEEERIAEDIRKQLLREMEEELTGGEQKLPESTLQPSSLKEEERAEKQEETAAEETGPVPEETAAEETGPVPEKTAAEESGPVLVETAAVSAPAMEKTAEEEKENEPPYRMVNVMEEILSPEVVKKEMEKYGVCLCSRCQADVLALLLTRLPAKYIVANVSAIPPLLSYYKNKYRVSLLTQTIKACMDVREHPRHDRKDPYDSGEFADK